MTAEGPAVRAIRAAIARGNIHPSAESRMIANAVLEDARAERRRGSQVTAAASGLPDLVAGAGEMSDDDADLLFPPRSSDQAEARFRAAERRVARLAELPDAELHASLFGDHVFAAQVGDVQDQGEGTEETDTTHAVYSGTHTHEHSDYQGSTHTHVHGHMEEASHDHHQQGDGMAG